MIELQNRAAFLLAQMGDFNKDEGLPPLTIVIIVSLLILLVFIVWAARRAMRRCIFCKHVCVPLAGTSLADVRQILQALADYEGSEVHPGKVMVCANCRIVYNCVPRIKVAGFLPLSKKVARTDGQLQVDHFACHGCGELLEDADSPCLNGADKTRVKRAVREAQSPADLGTALYCCKCKAVHLWTPLGDTGYKFLRADLSDEENG